MVLSVTCHSRSNLSSTVLISQTGKETDKTFCSLDSISLSVLQHTSLQLKWSECQCVSFAVSSLTSDDVFLCEFSYQLLKLSVTVDNYCQYCSLQYYWYVLSLFCCFLFNFCPVEISQIYFVQNCIISQCLKVTKRTFQTYGKNCVNKYFITINYYFLLF